MSRPENIRDLLAEARENGLRDLADTCDLILASDDPLEVEPSEMPLTGENALYFRSGVILGVEIEGEERPDARRIFVKSLRQRDQRRLADAFEYCWERSEELVTERFDPEEIPLEPEKTVFFSYGITIGIACLRAGKS